METRSENQGSSGTEAMATLSEYLELALEKGERLLMVSEQPGTFTLYLSKTASPDDEEDMRKCGSIPGGLGNAILNATQFGFNKLTFNDVTYRFTRSFAQLGSRGAVAFAAL
ncbi:hypothetical protein WQE_15331 [Paraburkholderia hospita]|uniref:Roadblock/LAMTOR2 domain-containing protein n=1 Tax=Paraburkholderia hospita TaxID=169430 RepID=A0ABN0FP13_9BURK|nr:hypothetical protein [Paraburkholderia hospita]EIN00415.1 hypothetical protein WQE_15331 [Paraburkholderia hospita]OUL88426.1 hypothetical protein CA602_11230 [Paraburkholderia hospita]